MIIFFGVLVIIVGLIAWVGQTLSFFAPEAATKIGALESKDEIDETLYVFESKAMGLVDIFTTWIFPASGLLLLLNNSLWPYFGLVGAGVYLYFSGVIILSRIYLKRMGKKVGSAISVVTVYVYGAVCILTSLIMIAMSVSKLTVQQ